MFLLLFLVWGSLYLTCVQSASITVWNNTACTIPFNTGPSNTGTNVLPYITVNVCYAIPNNVGVYLNVTTCTIGGVVNVTIYENIDDCMANINAMVHVGALDQVCSRVPPQSPSLQFPNAVIPDCSAPSDLSGSTSSDIGWTLDDTIIVSVVVPVGLVVFIVALLLYFMYPKCKGYTTTST